MDYFVTQASTSTVTDLDIVKIIDTVIGHPGIFVFGELLDLPSIKQLENGPHAAHYRLLLLFAYGTYKEWMARTANQYPELTSDQLNKLKQLTLVSLCENQRFISCEKLQRELDIPSLRDLEDLVITMIYADLIQGKLDQESKMLEIDYSMGRDVKPEQIPELADILNKWCATCEGMLSSITDEMKLASERHDKAVQNTNKLNEEFENMKKLVKMHPERFGQHPRSMQMEIDDPHTSHSMMTLENMMGSKELRKNKFPKGKVHRSSPNPAGSK